MVAITSRHRSLVLLAIAVVAQVLLLAVQIRQERKGRLIRVWAVAAITPFERMGTWGFGKIRGTWSHYFYLRDAAKENDELRRERDTLRMQVNQLQGKAAEADRLAALMNFRQAHRDVPLLPAMVIGASADTASQTIYIDRGARDGVQKNMGVITPEGVVGRVIDAYRDTAHVILLTDRDSGIGAMVADSRIQSPVGGTGEPLIVMKYVPNDDTVNVGDRVVTSGMDRIFPKDIPIGTVVDVQAGNPFKQIRVRTAANLERLEEVIVVLTLRPLEMKRPETKPEEEKGGAAAEPPAGAQAPKARR